jgi:hypothetical protein
MFPRSRRIVRSEVAGGHPNELERDRNDVRGRDEAPHEPALQPAIRKCQKDVQEENRGHQVEHLPKVCKTSRLDQTSVERKLTNPATISNGPKRLAGLRHHATRPQTT